MSLDPKELDRAISLSHLSVDDAQKARYFDQIDGVLTYMEQLNKLDLDTVSPSSHALETSTRLRPDTVQAPTDCLLEKNAPHWEAGGFRVPKILSDS